jgi:hypothetical protein
MAKKLPSSADDLLDVLDCDARISAFKEKISHIVTTRPPGTMTGEEYQELEDLDQQRALAEYSRKHVIDEINAKNGTLPLRRKIGRTIRHLFHS